MSSGPDFWDVLNQQVAPQFPYLVVSVVGIVVCAANLPRHRGPGVIAPTGFLVLFVVTLGWGLVSAFILADPTYLNAARLDLPRTRSGSPPWHGPGPSGG